MTPAPAESLLVDARFGPVTQLRPYRPAPGMPPSWVGWSARVARTRAFADWAADRYGFGASLGDGDRARRAALGEAVERYCGNAVPARLETAAWSTLDRPAADPASFALYSDRQHAIPGFPFVPFTRNLPVAWVPGTDLHTGEAALVPASQAYLNYFRGPHAAEPPTHALPYAGIATGENREHAERFALEELIERDATSIWWAAGGPADVLDDGGALAAEMGGQRTLRLLRVPTELAVPVVAALIEDPARGLLAFGSACRADSAEAAAKAVVEAIAMFALTAEVADPDSALWQAVGRGDFDRTTFRPFRADRRYAEEIRPDYRDVVDLPTLAQLYLDPRMQGAPLDRLRATGPRVPLSGLPSVPGPSARQAYLSRLADLDLRAYSVELTTDDVRSAGLAVVRVVVPGLYNNAPPAFPYLGGPRLYSTPARLGWREKPLTEDTLYPYPIPHV